MTKSNDHIIVNQKAEIDDLRVRLKVLRAALHPFANIPIHGLAGGPLVSCQIFFEDGTSGGALGKSPDWPGYIPKEWFERAKITYECSTTGTTHDLPRNVSKR